MLATFPASPLIGKTAPFAVTPKPRLPTCLEFTRFPPYSNEEIVTRDFLFESKPDGIIDIIDGTNIERNMYLTMQIMELGIPMVLALNMMDEVEKNGGTIRVNELRSGTRHPRCSYFCCKNQGVDELVETTLFTLLVFTSCQKANRLCPSSEEERNPLGRCIAASTQQLI